MLSLTGSVLPLDCPRSSPCLATFRSHREPLSVGVLLKPQIAAHRPADAAAFFFAFPLIPDARNRASSPRLIEGPMSKLVPSFLVCGTALVVTPSAAKARGHRSHSSGRKRANG